MAFFKDYNNLSNNIYDNAYILRKKQLSEAMVGRSGIYPSNEPAFPKPSPTSYSNPDLQSPLLGNTGDNRPNVVPPKTPSGLGTFATSPSQNLSPTATPPITQNQQSNPLANPQQPTQQKQNTQNQPQNLPSQTQSNPLMADEPLPPGLRGTGRALTGEGGGIIGQQGGYYQEKVKPVDIDWERVGGAEVPMGDKLKFGGESIFPKLQAALNSGSPIGGSNNTNNNLNYRPGFSNAPAEMTTDDKNREIAERNRKRAGVGVNQMLQQGLQLAGQYGLNPAGQFGSGGGLNPGAMNLPTRSVGYMNQTNPSGYRMSRGFV